MAVMTKTTMTMMRIVMMNDSTFDLGPISNKTFNWPRGIHSKELLEIYVDILQGYDIKCDNIRRIAGTRYASTVSLFGQIECQPDADNIVLTLTTVDGFLMKLPVFVDSSHDMQTMIGQVLQEIIKKNSVLTEPKLEEGLT